MGGLCSRVGNAIWDLFARGFSVTTRSEILGDIIFGRRPVRLPLHYKQGDGATALSLLVSNLKDAGVNVTKVKFEPNTDQPKFFTPAGAAKDSSRHVIARFFLDKVDEDTHFSMNHGHAAIEVRNSESPKKSYMGLYLNPNTGETFSALNYKEDKQLRLTKLTNNKLEQGMLPRPYQHKLKNPGKSNSVNTFGTSASTKIYLPCFGMSRKKNGKDVGSEKIKVLFGLSETNARAEIALTHKAIYDENFAYRKISRDRNCSGLVMQMLKKGGATTFVRNPKADFFRTPQEVQEYARELQQYLDTINNYTDKLISVFEPHDEPGVEPQSNSPAMSAADLEKFSIEMGTSKIKEFTEFLKKDYRKLSNEFLMNPAQILVGYLAHELGNDPRKALSALPPEKQVMLKDMISLVSAIRDQVCKEEI
jgi:hypothetical protein